MTEEWQFRKHHHNSVRSAAVNSGSTVFLQRGMVGKYYGKQMNEELKKLGHDSIQQEKCICNTRKLLHQTK